MKNIFLFVTALITSFFLAAGTIYAADTERTPRNVILGSDQVVDHDYFAAGDSVILSGTVNGDAYIAGGNITVDGVVNGDLMVAGGNLNLRGTVAGDIRTAGGNISISSEVGGNITAMGGSVTVQETAVVPGSLVAGAGELTVLAPIGRGVTAGSGTFYLDNNVGGDVNYWGEQDPSLGPLASVSGSLTRHETPQPQVDEQQFARAVKGMAFTFNLLSLIGLFVLGAILIKLAPNFVSGALQPADTMTWKSFGTGLAYMILTPFVFVILFMTVVGIPLGVIILFMYIILFMVGKVMGSLYLGRKVFGYFGKSDNLYLHLLLGLALFQALYFIKFFGSLVSAVVFLIAVGSLMLFKVEFYRNLVSKKLV